MTEADFTSDDLKEVEVGFLSSTLFFLQMTKAAHRRHSFADVPLQVLIHGKNDCMENMKENGSKFSHGMLCAGGKKKGTCFVRTTFLVNISLIKLN